MGLDASSLDFFILKQEICAVGYGAGTVPDTFPSLLTMLLSLEPRKAATNMNLYQTPSTKRTLGLAIMLEAT